MNCSIILLFFLLCGNNGFFGNSGCGCGCDDRCDRDDDRRPCQRPEPRRGRDDEPRREDNCSCDDSRFEPRFESRPFSNSGTCGCEEK